MMRKFNLQPWREERRQKQKKQFVAITLALLALVVVVCLAERWYQLSIVSQQESGIATLEQDINKFSYAESEVKRLNDLNAEVNRQIDVIHGLQNQQGLAIEILDYIANNTPENVFLTSIDFKDMKLVIKGVAENDPGVSEFLRNMDKFKYAVKSDVTNIQSSESNNLYTVLDNNEVKKFEVIIQINSEMEMQP